MRYKIENNLFQIHVPNRSHGKNEIFLSGAFWARCFVLTIKSIVIGHFEWGIPHFPEVVMILKQRERLSKHIQQTLKVTISLRGELLIYLYFSFCELQIICVCPYYLNLVLITLPINSLMKPVRRFNTVSFFFGLVVVLPGSKDNCIHHIICDCEKRNYHGWNYLFILLYGELTTCMNWCLSQTVW